MTDAYVAIAVGVSGRESWFHTLRHYWTMRPTRRTLNPCWSTEHRVTRESFARLRARGKATLKRTGLTWASGRNAAEGADEYHARALLLLATIAISYAERAA